ncbi:hypothetical protein SKAU_G00226520 [Synaphobranchus kaupii]|uniref:Uncharacterized protein n=1 Tax=Synaphobranchus kaupii TaxID=118154 RepID=A0A9Q1ISX0_SYNKA|nr:hypothetical protein SKAU_G00226520 [Synaphobranchus kaupii]
MGSEALRPCEALPAQHSTKDLPPPRDFCSVEGAGGKRRSCLSECRATRKVLMAMAVCFVAGCVLLGSPS